MTFNAFLQFGVYLAVLLLLLKPLGWYMAQVYEGRLSWLKPIEHGLYRCCGIRSDQEMSWRRYAAAVLLFNLIGFLFLFALQRVQAQLPLNPAHFGAVSPDLSFNTALSFITNTNWQAYGGETTMSYLTQMLGMTVQNFLSAATGMAVLVALIRGLHRHETTEVGNFWVDMVRSTLYILLPLSIILAVGLSSQGVIQNIHAAKTITTLTQAHQVLPMGPVASQTAIEQLGSNGGGFFNVNDAHPFQNPTPLTNLLEMLAILLIPASLCYTYGKMIKDTRQGWAILIAMLILLIPIACIMVSAEQHSIPSFAHLGLDPSQGNMEGKETRFGIVDSSLWTTFTTATSNGSVNSALDSFTPVGGLLSLCLMQLGEVVFGGVGTGLYGMIILVIIAVFLAGLMVGRTPEYLGKKIAPYEMKIAAFVVLIMPLIVLLSTAWGVLDKTALSAMANPGAHGFTELLYAFSSMGNNNGSAFAGLNANVPFYNLLGGVVIFIGRFWVIISVLAIAGSMAQKKIVATTVGTLPTHNLLFILLLVVTVIIIGALTFLPALALGPIVEQLQILL